MASWYEPVREARRAWLKTQDQLTLEVDWLTSKDLPPLPSSGASPTTSSPKTTGSGRRAAAENIHLYEGEMMDNGIGLLLTVIGLLLAFGIFSLYADRKRDQLRREDRLIHRNLMRLKEQQMRRPLDEIWSDDPYSRRVPALSMSVRPDLAEAFWNNTPVVELRPDVREALEDLHRHLNPVT